MNPLSSPIIFGSGLTPSKSLRDGDSASRSVQRLTGDFTAINVSQKNKCFDIFFKSLSQYHFSYLSLSPDYLDVRGYNSISCIMYIVQTMCRFQ